MHGDRVLASVTGVDRRGRREGAIVEVLERRLNRLIGRFVIEAGIGYVVPDDRRIQRNVLIPPDAHMDARNGQLVVCETGAGARSAASADRARAGGAGRPPDRFAGGAGGDPRTRYPARVPAGRARRSRGGAADRRCSDRGAARRPARVAAGHHRRRGRQGLRRRGVLRAQPQRLPPGCGDRRRVALRASRDAARRGGHEARRRRSISPASSCRCCRRPCPTASARSIPRSTGCASSATCRSTATARSPIRSSTRR